MNQKIEIGLVVLLAAGLLVGGCGEDDKPTPLSGPFDLEIRQGTWMISETISFLGADSCLARPDTTVDSTGVICNVNVGAAPEQVAVDCDLETSATSDSIQYVCTLTTNLGLCNFVITLSGEGTVNDTTFSLRNLAYSKVVPREGATQAECDLLFGNAVDPCTTLIDFSGTWIDTSGVSDCPSDLNAPGVPLTDLIHGMALEALDR